MEQIVVTKKFLGCLEGHGGQVTSIVSGISKTDD